MLARNGRRFVQNALRTVPMLVHGRRLATTTNKMNVFDRAVKKMHKDRAAIRIENGTNVAADMDYIRKEIALHLMDRIDVRTRTIRVRSQEMQSELSSTILLFLSAGHQRTTCVSNYSGAWCPRQ
jgi:hypothetical protein